MVPRRHPSGMRYNSKWILLNRTILWRWTMERKVIDFVSEKRRRENLAKMARMDEIEAEMNEMFVEFVFRPEQAND